MLRPFTESSKRSHLYFCITAKAADGCFLKREQQLCMTKKGPRNKAESLAFFTIDGRSIYLSSLPSSPPSSLAMSGASAPCLTWPFLLP